MVLRGDGCKPMSLDPCDAVYVEWLDVFDLAALCCGLCCQFSSVLAAAKGSRCFSTCSFESLVKAVGCKTLEELTRVLHHTASTKHRGW